MRRVLVFLGGQSALEWSARSPMSERNKKKGSPNWAPPSSLLGFRRALEQGIDLEIDARVTRDEHIVVFHDPTVDRRTNGTGKVIDMSLEEIKKLDAGSWFDPEFKDVKVLTLQEVFDLFQAYEERIIDIHLKETMEGHEGKIAEMVEDYKLVDRIQFHVNNSGGDSLPPEMLKSIKEIDGKLKVGTNLSVSDRSQITQFINSFSHLDYFWVEETEERFWIDDKLISEIHNLQKEVVVGAKPSTFERCKELIDIGVDGINADSPLDIRRYLNQKAQHR